MARIGFDPLTCTEVRRRAEHEREALVSLCGALVAARSDQPVGDTSAPAAVLMAFLRGRGLSPEIRARRAEKPNVVCTVAGAWPGPHLILNGHLDTLPPGDESAWRVPVHSMMRAGGRLTGLGIGNMKAGTAALALALALLWDMRERLAGRITFAAVADEVVFGPDGAEWLLEADPDLRGDALINAEGPGYMDLAIAEKGLLWIEIAATAPPRQGMLTVRGSGAIARLSALLLEIDGWNEERAMPPAGLEALSEAAGEHGLRLSANVGRVDGGSFISQAPTHARADIDVRIPPGLTVEALVARLDAIAASVPGISWQRIKGWNPNWTAPDAPLSRLVKEAAEAVRGTAPRPVVRLPASDAARWRARGVPAICFGPQPTLASGVDDYVVEQDVVDCAAIYTLAALAFLQDRP